MSAVGTEVDVAVVGAGPAGMAAAVAAAATGVRVALIDRGPQLGGNIGNAFVHTICGLYEGEPSASPASAPSTRPDFSNGGFAPALAESLRSGGVAGAPERAGRVWFLPISPAGFARFEARLLEASPEIDRRVPTELAGAESSDRGVELSLADGGRMRASIAIDASGDGALADAVAADVESVGPDRLQHPSTIVVLEGIAPQTLVELRGFARVQVTAAVGRAARTGELPAECRSATLRVAPSELVGASAADGAGEETDGGLVYATLTFPKPDSYDPIDASQRERLGEEARSHAERIVAFLRATRPGFEEVRVAAWPSRIGVRESRRVLGRFVVDRDHVLGGASHPDEVARSSWPIELWHAPEGARFEHPSGSSSVPLGALVSRSHPRLGMAGRCLSATHEAHGSLRVVGTALATGEAIGLGAAIAAREGRTLADLDPEEVREARRKAGPVLAERLAAAETRGS